MLFCFEIFLSGEELFSGFEVLNGNLSFFFKLVATDQNAAIAAKTKIKGQKSFRYLISSFSVWDFFPASPPMEF